MTRTSYYFGAVTALLAAAVGVIAALVMLLGPTALPAQAQSTPTGTTITVNTNADEDNTDADCSLREAIKAANTNGAVDACPAGSSTAEDTIDFDLGSSPVTITLGSTLPNVTDGAGLVIDGGSAGASVSVSGNDKVRVLYNQAKLTLRDLTITRGRAFMADTSYCDTDPRARGGAIYNAGGTLELSNVTLSANKAQYSGGAIEDASGSLKVTDSTFSANEGGWIFPVPRGCLGGGAISGVHQNDEITNTTFTNNRGYYGGAIYGGSPKITNSTFSGNLAALGAAITGGPKVYNSTFVSNDASTNGGAIYSVGTRDAEFTNVTFANNDSQAPATISGYATLRNTIISGAGCNTEPNDAGGNIQFNRKTWGSCSFSEDANSIPNIDPQLVGLADNGGPTKTMALLPTSPAIDLIPQGTNGCGTDLKEDQRGVTRPQGPACDAGAFEAPPDVTAPAAPAIASPTESSSNAACFTVSGTAEVNTTVELFEGAESLGTAGPELSGRWSVALKDVPNGPHSYTAKATDPAGNTSSASGTRALTVEWAAPEAPAITAPAQGAFDEDGSFSVVGTAEPGVEVELFEDGTSKGKTTAGSDGGWSFSLSGVAEGSHSYKAKVTDAACGASAESEARTVIVDMTSPSVGAVVPAEDATGVSARANVSALFSEEMQATSVMGAFKLYKGTSTRALKARVTYDAAAGRAVLNPSADLKAGATYRVVIGTGAKDLASHALDQDPEASGNQEKVWTFKVRR